MLDAYECIGGGSLHDLLQAYISQLLEQLLELEVHPGKWRTILDDP